MLGTDRQDDSVAPNNKLYIMLIMYLGMSLERFPRHGTQGKGN